MEEMLDATSFPTKRCRNDDNVLYDTETKVYDFTTDDMDDTSSSTSRQLLKSTTLPYLHRRHYRSSGRA